MNLLLKKYISFHKQQFNTVSKVDSGEYSCEARNSVGYRRCPGKRMQVGKHEYWEKQMVCNQSMQIYGNGKEQGIGKG